MKKITVYLKIAALIFSLGIGFSIGGLIAGITLYLLTIGVAFLIVSCFMFILATFNSKLVFLKEIRDEETQK